MDVCRLCLSESPDQDIYQLKIGHENDYKFYPHILQFCLNIEVDEEMQITKKLCTKCYLNVLNFYKFKTLALKTDIYWRSKASVKHEALEDNEVSVLEDPSYYDLSVKQEGRFDNELYNDYDGPSVDGEEFDNEDLMNENQIEDVNDYDGPSEDDDQFDNEDLMNENQIEDVNENSSDEELYQSLQSRKDNKNQQKDVSESENSSDKEDPNYEPSEYFKNNIKQKNNLSKSIPKEDTPNHNSEEKASESLDYPCEACDRKFSSNDIKSRHFRKVHGKPKKRCPICNKEVQSLQSHILMVHEPHKLRYKCEACGRRFLNESTKNNHTCPKSENMGMSCHICNKKLSSRRILEEHIRRVHEREKRYMCQFCSHAFFRRSHLDSHLRQHTKERPYKCTECDKSYPSTTSLRLHHESKHTVRGRFPCTLCPKVFSVKYYLAKHIRSRHTNPTGFECGYKCGVNFTRRDNCRAHEKRQHGFALTPIARLDKEQSCHDVAA